MPPNQAYERPEEVTVSRGFFRLREDEAIIKATFDFPFKGEVTIERILTRAHVEGIKALIEKAGTPVPTPDNKSS
jgi:hypothetical protein